MRLDLIKIYYIYKYIYTWSSYSIKIFWNLKKSNEIRISRSSLAALGVEDQFGARTRPCLQKAMEKHTPSKCLLNYTGTRIQNQIEPGHCVSLRSHTSLGFQAECLRGSLSLPVEIRIPLEGPEQFSFQLWAIFPRRVVLKLVSPHPTWSDVSPVSSRLRVWTYSLVESSGLRHYQFPLKCKFILHTAAPVVFLLLPFISFLSSECLTIMKPGLLRDASPALWYVPTLQPLLFHHLLKASTQTQPLGEI